jgi:hypothetical protein
MYSRLQPSRHTFSIPLTSDKAGILLKKHEEEYLVFQPTPYEKIFANLSTM